jgi:HAD superfamily hydrolase (TIGR01490 family)
LSQIAAIFDLDRTLITRSSAILFVKYLRQSNQMWRFFRPRDLAMLALDMIRYKLGMLDGNIAIRRSANLSAGIDVDEMWALINEWSADMLVHFISEPARERLTWHRDQGHIPVVCSAASQFSVKPIADLLDIKEQVYTEWLVADNRLTGQLREPITFGPGKVYWMQKWAAEHDADLSRSYFYSDDAVDLPLLEIVEHPIAVNAHRPLRKIAKARQWPILTWK